MRNFRELTIWNQGIDLTVKVYEVCKQLPKEELYGLRSQITRAVVSIPSNIAEAAVAKASGILSAFLKFHLAPVSN
jgi:four helix bundle protein